MGQFDNFEVCDHPFDPFIKSGCKILVIGTFPTHAKNYKETFKFYYAGQGNMFWPVIEEVFDKTFHFSKGDEAKKEREEFLELKGIGLVDMLAKAYRKNTKSQDEYIYPIVFTDIFSILRTHETIETIILTSRTKIVGALGLFETYLIQNNESLPTFSTYERVKEGHFRFEQREIEILIPYSTSRTVIEEERATFEELAEMYSRCLT